MEVRDVSGRVRVLFFFGIPQLVGRDPGFGDREGGRRKGTRCEQLMWGNQRDFGNDCDAGRGCLVGRDPQWGVR